MDVKWGAALAEIIANASDLAAAQLAPALAAEIAAVLYRERPDAELLAFWLADLLLAQKMRRSVPVPLLMAQAHSLAFKAGEQSRRIRPGGEGQAVLLSYAQVAAEALTWPPDLALRAGRNGAETPVPRGRRYRQDASR